MSGSNSVLYYSMKTTKINGLENENLEESADWVSKSPQRPPPTKMRKQLKKVETIVPQLTRKRGFYEIAPKQASYVDKAFHYSPRPNSSRQGKSYTTS